MTGGVGSNQGGVQKIEMKKDRRHALGLRELVLDRFGPKGETVRFVECWVGSWACYIRAVDKEISHFPFSFSLFSSLRAECSVLSPPSLIFFSDE